MTRDPRSVVRALSSLRRSVPLKALVLALAVSASASCGGGASTPSNAEPDEIGLYVVPVGQRQPAPTLSGTTLSGDHFDLADHVGGHVILVNVWASWCAPCRREMPMLARAAARGRRHGLLVVGIDEHDTASTARAYSSSLGATFPSIVDPDSTVLTKLAILPPNGVPSSMFIDADGGVAARVIGGISSQELATVLGTLRKES